MRCLLDTHALLWMIDGSERLSTVAREVIADTGNALHFSMASYWEIGIKISLEKLTLASDWQETIPREMTRNNVSWLSIRAPHIHEVSRLQWHHRDPFDRLLASQARVESLSIVSVDAQFDVYGVERVW